MDVQVGNEAAGGQQQGEEVIGAGQDADAGVQVGGHGAAAAEPFAQLTAALQQLVVNRPVVSKPPMYRQGQDFRLWLERFDLYILEVPVPAERRRGELLKFLDLDTAFKAVHSMQLPEDMPYLEVCERLKVRFGKYLTQGDAKMAFQAREQGSTESREDYVDALSKLGSEAYPNPAYTVESRAELVFERFRRGVTVTPDVRERLFTERLEGVREALSLIRNIELGRKQLKGAQGRSDEDKRVIAELKKQLEVTKQASEEMGLLRTMAEEVASLKKQWVKSGTPAAPQQPESEGRQWIPAPHAVGQRTSTQGPMDKFCRWCGEFGHEMAQCVERIAREEHNRQPSCVGCGGDHWARDCRRNQDRRVGPGARAGCFQCGGPHFRRECPQLLGQGNGRAGPVSGQNRPVALPRP